MSRNRERTLSSYERGKARGRAMLGEKKTPDVNKPKNAPETRQERAKPKIGDDRLFRLFIAMPKSKRCAYWLVPECTTERQTPRCMVNMPIRSCYLASIKCITI